MAVPTFSNSPKFQAKPVTIDGLLTMTKFDLAAEVNPFTSSAANSLGTDKNNLQGLTWEKNIAHKNIHLSGEDIGINFFYDLFFTSENYVNTKVFYNRYTGEANFNVYFASTTSGTGTCVGQLIPSNHSNGGAYSLPNPPYLIVDKDAHKMYEITTKDTSIPNAHKITVRSLVSSTDPITLYENKPYLVLQAASVGDYSCPIPMESWQTLGWARENYFKRFRKDASIEISVMRGYQDQARFSVLMDDTGKEYDVWDFYEMMQMRKQMRYAFNAYSFDGSPDFNTTYINTGGISGQDLDKWTIGYYGLNPSLRFGGCIYVPYSASVGWDWETDYEPILLYNDSIKRTKEYTALGGLGFNLKTVDRTNKMVARTVVGTLAFDAFKRGANERGEKDMETAVSKIGLSSYSYKSRVVNIKEWGELSDDRSIGTEKNRYSAYFSPHGGITENGKECQAIEFNQIKTGSWGGDYYEEWRDMRKINGCEEIQLQCAQSQNMIVHNPEFWVLAEGFQNN